MILRPPTSTLFPYTTLFRSTTAEVADENGVAEFAEIARGPNNSPGRIEPSTMLKTADVLSVGRIDFDETQTDRKSTRLNSSHSSISYAVFCLKKKNKTQDKF